MINSVSRLVMTFFSLLLYYNDCIIIQFGNKEADKIKMRGKIMGNNNSIIFALGGEIDHHNAAGLRYEIDELIMNERPHILTFDFTNVKFMDSSGIGLVLGRHRILLAMGGSVEIIGASNEIERLFKMSGVDKIVRIT